MSRTQFAFWRRLDQPGHDVARLSQSAEGWRLEGYAAFRENGSTGLRYSVELAADYSTRAAAIEGHRSGRPFVHEFRREAGEWFIDGAIVPRCAT